MNLAVRPSLGADVGAEAAEAVDEVGVDVVRRLLLPRQRSQNNAAVVVCKNSSNGLRDLTQVRERVQATLNNPFRMTSRSEILCKCTGCRVG